MRRGECSKGAIWTRGSGRDGSVELYRRVKVTKTPEQLEGGKESEVWAAVTGKTMVDKAQRHITQC